VSIELLLVTQRVEVGLDLQWNDRGRVVSQIMLESLFIDSHLDVRVVIVCAFANLLFVTRLPADRGSFQS
jgi:hypothetical protein